MTNTRDIWNSRAARNAAIAIFAALALLRVVRAFTLGPNSDEAQHLHVVWAWTQGLVVYRDVFDNHTPLFHVLCAPLLAWLGERADIIAWMRLAMIPLYFGALYATWRIGRAIGSPRVGLCAALLVGSTQAFFDVSTQFRPDDLWMLFWLGATAVAVQGRPTNRRALAAGVLVGAAFATSAKTSLLVSTALLAGVAVLALDPRERGARLRALAVPLLWGVIGALVVPVVVALYFVVQGAWREALYCIFEHNLVRGLGRWQSGGARFWLFPFGFALALAVALHFRKRSEPARWRAASWVLLSAIGYLLALHSYWPLFTRQDMLPVLPLLALMPAALFTGGSGGWRSWRVLAVGAVLAVFLGSLVAQALAPSNRLRHAERDLAQILALTRPGEYVMDAKGESIFRPRPFYWVLEGVTEARMRNGSIRDDLGERLAATSTALLVDDRIPARDRAFVEANYVPVGHRLRVAGQRFGPLDAGQAVDFRIEVAGDYRFIDRNGDMAGTFDGRRVEGAVSIDAGEHRFVPDVAADVALVRASVFERGLAPSSVFAPEAQDERPASCPQPHGSPPPE